MAEVHPVIIRRVVHFKIDLPITFISQISIDVYTSLSLPGHADLYPTGLLFVNTICRTSLLIVMFCIGAGHPDIGSWRYIRLFGSGDEILKV